MKINVLYFRFEDPKKTNVKLTLNTFVYFFFSCNKALAETE